MIVINIFNYTIIICKRKRKTDIPYEEDYINNNMGFYNASER